jgi:glycosyltransferase involved in cell wall biosynthesis
MSYEGRTVAVVIPAHDEAAFIGNVIRAIPSYVDAIILVDDASADDTAGVAKQIRDTRVEVHTLSRNSGVGGAMVVGYRRALDKRNEVIVKLDGDGQMSPDDMPALLDAVTKEGYSYAKGNRFLVGDPRIKMPPSRFVGNMILTFLTKLASGYWHIFDTQNGYTAINAGALKQLDLDRIHKGYFFENDILVQLNVLNFRVRDVPMQARYGNETSDVRPIWIGLSFSRFLLHRFALRVYQKYMLRDFSPIALFLLVGATFVLWGIGFGGYLWVRSVISGAPTLTGTIMLAVVPLFMGFQLLLQAVVLDISATPK